MFLHRSQLVKSKANAKDHEYPLISIDTRQLIRFKNHNKEDEEHKEAMML